MAARPRHRNRCGAAMVELAVLLPLLAMITLGIIEFGRALTISQLLATAVRDGARLAAQDGSSNAQVTQVVKSRVQTVTGLSANQITVTIAVTPAENHPPVADVATALERDLCEVTAQVPFDDVSYIVPKHLLGKQLVGHCALRHE